MKEKTQDILTGIGMMVVILLVIGIWFCLGYVANHFIVKYW